MAAIHHRPHTLPATDPPAWYLQGMHGMGDNLHQRGIVRHLMSRAPVWLETSWPWVYHDLVGPRLHLVAKGAPVAVYARNARREADAFSAQAVPAGAVPLRVQWQATDMRALAGAERIEERSILAAFCRRVGVPLRDCLDFRLPIDADWNAQAQMWIDRWRAARIAAHPGAPPKPLMIVRPLVERSWWKGCTRRNPDHAVYRQIYEALRPHFFTVSVAELVPGEEWEVGEPLQTDVRLHAGELPMPVLAAVMARAAMVYTSPGFAVILAQAVSTPSIVVHGGYESARSFAGGAYYTPTLSIEPVTPCECFSHEHPCDKRTDVAAAVRRVGEFVSAPRQSSAGAQEISTARAEYSLGGAE